MYIRTIAMEATYNSPSVRILTINAMNLPEEWENYSFSAPYWRLYWNAAPGAEVVWKSNRTPLRPDRLVIIPPDTAFTAKCAHRPRHLYIHFLVGSPLDAALPGVYHRPVRGDLRQMAAALASGEVEQRSSTLMALSLIHATLCALPPEAIRPTPSDPRIHRVLKAMDAHLQQPLSNIQLAEIAQMSVNSFLRLFREQTGSSPQAVYLRKRIDHSCMQLHFTDMKMEQVAQMAGFCDRYHFSRTFKRLRGIGPAAFRRQSSYLAGM